MVGKKSGRALLREEGLERTDNEMNLTTWPQVTMINQKNYYTDYLKRDDQVLALRKVADEHRERLATIARNRDREAAHVNEVQTGGSEDADSEDGRVGVQLPGDEPEHDADAPGSDIIVIHLGSQNMRIGVASDALPKTVPMVTAKRWHECEAEEEDGAPLPKRQKTGAVSERSRCDRLFGREFSQRVQEASLNFKTRMKNNKLRLTPNAKELVVSYNKRVSPDVISEHNDAGRVTFTEVSNPEGGGFIAHCTGSAALRVPDYSKPRYKLFKPIRHGWLNEEDYHSKQILMADITRIIEDTLKRDFNLQTREHRWHSCVFIIPDLYERQYVASMVDMLLRDLSFLKVCVIQESLASTFGAGYAQACVIDVGAEKTSICCVDEGMCIEQSRLNLKYGGSDVTLCLIKMLLYNYFPYDEINLKRRYDWLLAEELKKKICTMSEPEVAAQLFDFHLRAFGQDTKKYSFKAYEEIILAPLAFYDTAFIDFAGKDRGRRSLLPRSADVYDNSPSETQSAAQTSLLTSLLPPDRRVSAVAAMETNTLASTRIDKQLVDNDLEVDEPVADVVISGNEDSLDHQPTLGDRFGTPRLAEGQLNRQSDGAPSDEPSTVQLDSILPVMRLDAAVHSSIEHASTGDERRQRDLLSSIMVVGGGSMVPGFAHALEARLKEMKPQFAKDILVGGPPRELDAQVVCWKGASVFAKLSNNNDSWISQVEWDRLGSRVLAYKCLFPF